MDNRSAVDSSLLQFADGDEKYMRRCLELAALAEGHTSPNPLVGCVVLDKNGIVVGEGFHPRAGESHAEVFALEQAGAAAIGGTLYCSLEPCCHFGRTPPCSDRVIKSGVARVVVGIQDPNPKVEGRGLKALRDAGLDLFFGVLEKECRYQNRGFLKVMTQGLPWVALKMATTLDGKIADRNGGSRWISGAASREYVMDLRSRFDAVMVGAGTARVDNPSLTVRFGDGGVNPLSAPEVSRVGLKPLGLAHPVKVVLDPRLSLSPESKIFEVGRTDNVDKSDKSDKSVLPATVIVFCGEDTSSYQHAVSDYAAHVAIVAVQCYAGNTRQELALEPCLKALKERGINKVLCEGGAHLAGALFDSKLVDEVYWFVAPKIIGDERSLAAVSSRNERLIADSPSLDIIEHKIFGDDVLIHGLVAV